MLIAPILLLAAALSPPVGHPDEVLRSRHLVVAPAESLLVTTVGVGSDIVLIPGMLGGAFTWRHIANELAGRGHRVTVIELLGMGMSSRPKTADYSLEAQATRLLVAFDSLGIASAVVAAHSIAGSVTMRAALRAPQRFAAIVAVECGTDERAAGASVGRALTLAPLIKLLGTARILKGKIRAGLRGASGDSSWVSDSILAGYLAGPLANPGATLESLKAMSRANEPQLLVPRLASLSMPVTLLLGDARHEATVPADAIVAMQHAIPDFTIHRIAGAGHYLQEERPTDVVNAILARTATLAHAGDHEE
jgi:pimeloyl-ACP methyl ester carboxylesterase